MKLLYIMLYKLDLEAKVSIIVIGIYNLNLIFI